MAVKPTRIPSLLACVQAAAARHKTNPYQIAKATGLPLRSIQKLLSQSSNPTLKNVDIILDGFGLSLFMQKDREGTIKPGTPARKPRRKPGER